MVLAGSGVLSRRNGAFSAGQVVMLMVSVDVDGIRRYCCRSSAGVVDTAVERRRDKKSSSSSSAVAAAAATVTRTANLLNYY